MTVSVSVEKLEASLRWAIEKYGAQSPLVRSLQEQLRIRKSAGAEARELGALAEELREPPPDPTHPASPRVEPQPAPAEALTGSWRIENPDPGDLDDLPSVEIGERVGRKRWGE